MTPRTRRKGLGAAMLRAAIDQARRCPGVLHVHLSVTEPAKDARRLYLAAGFREWGVEPRGLQWEGRFVAERHLVLDLRAAIAA